MFDEKKIDFLGKIKIDIISRLEDMQGESNFLCDIGFKLTEVENYNGSWYCLASAAKEDVFGNIDIFGGAAEYMRDNWNDTTNPLLDTELFHCKAMIAIYESIFNVAVSEWDEWNEEVEINKDFIERVKNALENVTKIF